MQFGFRRFPNHVVGVYVNDTFPHRIGNVRGFLRAGLYIENEGAIDVAGHRLILAAVDRGIELGFWDDGDEREVLNVEVSVPAHTGDVPRASGEVA